MQIWVKSFWISSTRFLRNALSKNFALIRENFAPLRSPNSWISSLEMCARLIVADRWTLLDNHRNAELILLDFLFQQKCCIVFPISFLLGLTTAAEGARCSGLKLLIELIIIPAGHPEERSQSLAICLPSSVGRIPSSSTKRWLINNPSQLIRWTVLNQFTIWIVNLFRNTPDATRPLE